MQPMRKGVVVMDSTSSCGFTCQVCGAFRSGPEMHWHTPENCLRRQLATANEHIVTLIHQRDSEYLRFVGAERSEAAANERVAKLEANLRSLCERLDEWWYEADPMDDVKKGERHPWTVNARKALEVPDADPA